MSRLNASKESIYRVKSPVLFIVFNRPEPTRIVFEAIRQVRPSKLYVAADGPRSQRPEDLGNVAAVRTIATAVDWPCEVKTFFRDHNLGCGCAVSGAITWFFHNEPSGIILEDDCVPVADFFRLCDEMLARYAGDKRVWAVNGTYNAGNPPPASPYYFSNYVHVWGWASWRDRWAEYEFQPDWHKEAHQIRNTLGLFDRAQRRYWYRVFQRMGGEEIDTWDYQFLLSAWRNRGLAVTPRTNLVTNIGFGEGATHTLDASSPLANRPLGSLPDDLQMAASVIADTHLDRRSFHHHFQAKMSTRIWRKFRSLLGRVLARIGFPA